MARQLDDTWSWIVAGARIVLPLTALSLLSLLFLVSDRTDPTQPIPYADIDLAELAREPRLTAPQFSGVTEDGAELTFTASGARPEAVAQGASATDVVARLQSPGGFSADVTARLASLDPVAAEVRLSGEVRLVTSAGYTISADEIVLATDRSRIEAPGPVLAEAPFGRLDAGGMDLRTEAAGAPYLLVFNGGVKLIYQPLN